MAEQFPAGIPYDEHIRAFWLDEDPDDPSAPTLAEVTPGAGVLDISGYLTIDGLATNHEDQRVDGSNLLSGWNAESMGREGAKPALTLKRKLKDGNTAAFDKFKTRQTGCLVVFPDIDPEDDPAAGDICDVYPACDTGRWKPQNTAANTEQRGVVEVAVGASMHLGVAVVAS